MTGDAEPVEEDEASRAKEAAGSETPAADHKVKEENSNVDFSAVTEKAEGQVSKGPQPEALGQKKDDEGSATEEAERGEEDGASAGKPAEESTMAGESLAGAVGKPLLDSGPASAEEPEPEISINPREQSADHSVTDHDVMEEPEGRNEAPKVNEAVEAPTDESFCTVVVKGSELEETGDSESQAPGWQKEEEAVDREPEEVGRDIRAPDPGPEIEKYPAEAVEGAVIKSEERGEDRTIEEPEERNETPKVSNDGSSTTVEVKEPELGKKDSETQAPEEDPASATKSTESSEEEEKEKEKEEGSETTGVGELSKETKIEEAEKYERTTEERDEGAVKKDEKTRNLAELFKQEGGPEVQQEEAPTRPSRSLMAKVKHSIGKMKKAIVGKSPPSGTIPGDGSGAT